MLPPPQVNEDMAFSAQLKAADLQGGGAAAERGTASLGFAGPAEPEHTAALSDWVSS